MHCHFLSFKCESLAQFINIVVQSSPPSRTNNVFPDWNLHFNNSPFSSLILSVSPFYFCFFNLSYRYLFMWMFGKYLYFCIWINFHLAQCFHVRPSLCVFKVLTFGWVKFSVSIYHILFIHPSMDIRLILHFALCRQTLLWI